MSKENNVSPPFLWQPKDIGTLHSFERRRELVARALQKGLQAIQQRYFKGGEAILEVGSGTGFLRRAWPPHTPIGRWVQYDCVSDFLDDAQRRFPEGTYVHGSALELCFPDESFDVVCGFNAYDNIANLETAAKKAARVLKPDGLFLHIMDLIPNPKPLSLSSNPEVLTSDMERDKMRESFYTQLKQALESAFDANTIEDLRITTKSVNKRTEGQRETAGFFFANIAGQYFIERSTTNHSLKDDSGPTFPQLIKWLERASNALHKFPQGSLIGNLIEPLCLEVSTLRFVAARK